MIKYITEIIDKLENINTKIITGINILNLFLTNNQGL